MKLFSNKPSSKESFLFDSRFKHFFCYYLVQRERYLLNPVILILITFFYGCIILPIPVAPDKVPYTDELKASIQIGVSTKNEVESSLGKPDAMRAYESVYIYSKPQTVAKIFGLFYTDHKMGLVDIDKAHLLIIQFDNNAIVKYLDHVVGSNTKTSNGLVVANAGLVSKGYGDLKLKQAPPPYDQTVILYASNSCDIQAKKFFSPEEKAVIFLFRKQYSFFSGSPHLLFGTITFDGVPKADTGPYGYYHWVVDEGTHDISITAPFFANLIIPGSVSLKADKGHIYFIEQTWEKEGFWITKYRGNLNIVSDADWGMQEIRKRNLVLDHLTLLE